MFPIFLVHETTIIDYSGTQSSDGTRSLSSISMRQLLSTTTVLDLHMGHVPYLLKRATYPHERDTISTITLDGQLRKSHIYRAKRKRQYILLIYQLYNPVSHRLCLFYKLDKLVMVTS